jgi:hypothetical protein
MVEPQTSKFEALALKLEVVDRLFKARGSKLEAQALKFDPRTSKFDHVAWKFEVV